MNIYIYDPRYYRIYQLDYQPNLKDPFIFWAGELREIRDIHFTKNGIQIELYKHLPWYLER